MTRRLYEITTDLRGLEEQLLESGGEWTPEIEALFAGVEGELSAKVDGYVSLIREWELDAEKWKAEEARMQAHRRARENAVKRLKDRFCQELLAVGRDKVETERFKVAVQRAAKTVEILGTPEQLPERYQTVIPASVVANKAAITADCKAHPDGILAVDEGEYEIVFARLVDGTPYLRIR